MDYLIGAKWPLCVLGFIVMVVIADEIWFRWERRNVALANRHHVYKPEPLEFIDQDELYVISTDTDEVVCKGTPAAVYDWLMIYQGPSPLDVYNQDTGKLVTSAYFKSKYVE